MCVFQSGDQWEKTQQKENKCLPVFRPRSRPFWRLTRSMTLPRPSPSRCRPALTSEPSVTPDSPRVTLSEERPVGTVRQMAVKGLKEVPGLDWVQRQRVELKHPVDQCLCFSCACLCVCFREGSGKCWVIVYRDGRSDSGTEECPRSFRWRQEQRKSRQRNRFAVQEERCLHHWSISEHTQHQRGHGHQLCQGWGSCSNVILLSKGTSSIWCGNSFCRLTTESFCPPAICFGVSTSLKPGL